MKLPPALVYVSIKANDAASSASWPNVMAPRHHLVTIAPLFPSRLCSIFLVPKSHHRAHLPGHEFIIAISKRFGLGLLSGSYSQHRPENFLPLGLERIAVEPIAAVDVHVVLHPLIHVGVGGDLDRGYRLAAIGRAAPGGEGQHIGAAGHL